MSHRFKACFNYRLTVLAPRPSEWHPENLNLNHKASPCTSHLPYQIRLCGTPTTRLFSTYSTILFKLLAPCSTRARDDCPSSSSPGSRPGLVPRTGRVSVSTGGMIDGNLAWQSRLKLSRQVLSPQITRAKSWTSTSFFWKLREQQEWIQEHTGWAKGGLELWIHETVYSCIITY